MNTTITIGRKMHEKRQASKDFLLNSGAVSIKQLCRVYFYSVL